MKTAGRRRMAELRMEVGVKENFKERQVIEIDRSGGENLGLGS